jgi:DinB family protein
MNFRQSAAALKQAMETVTPWLQKITDAEAAVRPAPDKWSKKEILGHLMDSAFNNHQRFVRATLQGELTFPGYDQDGLVKLERFQELDWKFLVELWTTFNKFLVHVIVNLPESALQVTCNIGPYKPATLAWIAEDYVEHMKHHLNQIFGKKFESAYSADAY